MNLQDIPIINYHKIIPTFDIGITSRHPAQFEADMAFLKNNGYTSITFEDLSKENFTVQRPVIITFDDGYDSVFEHALPILEISGFRCVVYIPSYYIGKSNDWDVQFGKFRFMHMNQMQIRQLMQRGHEIGSHSHFHQNLSVLPPDRISHELQESKKILEDLTGKRISSFSYPFGRYNDYILNKVKESGYQFGVSAVSFNSVKPEFVNLALPRYNIYRFDSKSAFKKKLRMSFSQPIGIRDWLIQRGGSATSTLQKIRRQGNK